MTKLLDIVIVDFESTISKKLYIVDITDNIVV